MKTFKLILRIVFTIIIGPPSLLILYPTFTLLGLIFIAPIIGTGQLILGFLLSSRLLIDDGFDSWALFIFAITGPWMFWWHFLNGRNPFYETGL